MGHLLPNVPPNLAKREGVLRVAVGICLKGHTPPESYHDRMMMAYNLGCRQVEEEVKGIVPRYEFFWFSAGEIFVPFARDQLAEMALRYDCDYLFMVDDDQMTSPNLFYDLARHGRDIVGALTFTRNPPHYPVIYEVIEGWDERLHAPYFLTSIVKSYPREKLVECDGIGFGAVLINTGVFKAMKRPWFMSTSPTGEDVLFCNSARKKGFKVFMDTSAKMGHLGHPVVITEEYADTVQGLDEKERERRYGRFEKYPTFDMVCR